jgi:hypothetical protein
MAEKRSVRGRSLVVDAVTDHVEDALSPSRSRRANPRTEPIQAVLDMKAVRDWWRCQLAQRGYEPDLIERMLADYEAAFRRWVCVF